jgi:hypothetical protein
MTTKAMSVADAEQQLAAARQKLNVLEGRLRSGQATLEEHIASKQFVHFADDVLKNVRERVADEERQQTESARIEKAHRDHDVLVEFYSSDLTEVGGEISATERQMVKLLETYKRHNTARRQVHGGIDWQALDEIAPVAGVNRNPQDLDGPQSLLAMVQRAVKSTGQTPPLASYEVKFGKFPDPDAIERHRDTVLSNKSPKPEPAASNGSHTTKGKGR